MEMLAHFADGFRFNSFSETDTLTGQAQL